MASTNKTANLGLSQWEGTDALSREDLNSDLRKIDEAAERLPVKLFDVSVSSGVQTVQIDFTGMDIEQYAELDIYVDSEHRDFYYTLNEVREEGKYQYYYGSNSSTDSKIDMMSGTARLGITKGMFYLGHDYCLNRYKMTRANFPALNSIEICYGYANPQFKVGDRVAVWGVKR